MAELEVGNDFAGKPGSHASNFPNGRMTNRLAWPRTATRGIYRTPEKYILTYVSTNFQGLGGKPGGSPPPADARLAGALPTRRLYGE